MGCRGPPRQRGGAGRDAHADARTRAVGDRRGLTLAGRRGRRTALGRLGEADDIAQAIVALHAMEWVTGQVVECDGGLSLHSPIDSYGEMLRTPRPGR